MGNRPLSPFTRAKRVLKLFDQPFALRLSALALTDVAQDEAGSGHALTIFENHRGHFHGK